MILASLRRTARLTAAFLAVALAASGPVWAAWTAAMVLEVQTGGSDANNSGGFKGGAYIAAPAAPTVTPSASGGTVAANTYYVVVTASDALGETVISGQTSVTTSGATASFTVTAVAAYTGALTWSCYVGTATGGPYFPQGISLAIGANRVVTTTPPTTGTQPRGVDYSQATGVHLAINNTTVTATTAGAASNVITFTGYTPTGADVGNTFRAVTGTNINAGDYEITAVTTTTWTVAGAANLTTGTGAGSAITGNMGGCFASPGGAGAFAVSGNTVYIKAGTYTILNGTINTAGNKFANPGNTIGYTSNRNLGNSDTPPVFDAGAASMTMCAPSGNGLYINNVSFTNSAARASVTALGGSGWGNSLNRQIQVSACTSGAIVAGANSAIVDCYATGSGQIGGGNGTSITRCVNIGTTGTFAFTGGAGSQFTDLIASGGSPGSGHYNIGQGGSATNCASNAAAGGTGHGYTFAADTIGTNLIAYGNAQIGYKIATSTPSVLLVNCASGGNGTDYDVNLAAYQKIGCITLGATPFTSAPTDFSLNTTSNGGALCRAAGIPGAFVGLSTTTGHRDIGAVQHADPTGGGFIPGPMMAPKAPRKTLPAQVPLKKAG